MFQLLRPGKPNDFLAEAYAEGTWVPKAVAVLSTPGESPKVLLIKLGPQKLKPNEKASWMPPQRQMHPGESIMDAGIRIITEETKLDAASIVPVRPLGFKKRGFQRNHDRPKGFPDAQGWLLYYAHFQIGACKKVAPRNKKVVEECRFVDQQEYTDLIKTASPAKQQLTNVAVVTSGVFPQVPMFAQA